MSECQKLWNKACEQLREKVDEDSWNRYLSGIVPVKLDRDQGHITLGVLNDFVALWLDSNYKTIIAEILCGVEGCYLEIEFEGGHEPPASAVSEPARPAPLFNASKNDSPKSELSIRPDFTFESFVIGNNNKISVAASKSVAMHPGVGYNPFFVYGGVGLGKTHLLQAIANECLRANSKRKIAYFTSEEFVNLYIEAVQNNTLPQFRKRFRTVDLLLIDDVQFFKGKVSSSEEFFHTFNALHNAHKQIVIAADRTPQELGLEDRMVSRFDGGLSVEILPPDLETRVAILKKKQQSQNIKLSDEVLFLIASRIHSNMRNLESALTILTMNVSAMGYDMDVDIAEELLQDKFDNEVSRMLTIDAIQRQVADYFDVKMSDIISKKRPQNIAQARMVAMYLSRQLTENSYPVIGEAFNRNHATIVHAVDAIGKRMAADESFRGTINQLTRQLKS